MQYYATYNIQCDVRYYVTPTMSININNRSHWNLFGIYLLSTLYVYSHFISAFENLSLLFLFHRRKMIVRFLLPLPKKILQSNVLLQSRFGGNSILCGDSSKPIGTQQQSQIDSWLRILFDKVCIRRLMHKPLISIQDCGRGKYGIGFRERGWFGATRPRPI